MKKKPVYSALPTEGSNAHTQDIDRVSPLQIAREINAEDFNAAKAVQKAEKAIAKAMVRAAATYLAGGRILFIGAGTSGRLGILEAAECVPTFGTDPEQIIGIIAGGPDAVFRSREGAEDDAAQGAKDLAARVQKDDFVIGITASGATPYVLGALKEAKKKKAFTALVSCNKKADVSHADIPIYLITGAEALCGSTRMKAGSATKMALNAITTGAMVLAGKTYRNLMVDVLATNAKLVARAKRLVSALVGSNDKEAGELLKLSGWKVKTAVVMGKKHVSKLTAEQLLREKNGFLKDILDEK